MDSHINNEKPLPWHNGELEIQRKAGVVEKAADLGRRFIRDHLIEQHSLFYQQLPFVVVGAVDDAGDPWATIIAGQPGFLRATDDYTLNVSFRRDPSDPADRGFNNSDAVGVLGIELNTRRRNRINGDVGNSGPAGFDVKVVQSYGNCPRYIQLRDFYFAREPGLPFVGDVELLPRLDSDAIEMINSADAFFVASYSEDASGRQADGSSRGGKPGFVRVDEDGSLTIPDFNGNTFFNTLGNVLLNGRAGLTFVDFSNGDMLQMTGRAKVIFDSAEIVAFQGAERFWNFKPEKLVRRRGALAIRWIKRESGESPNAVMTGDWQQVDERLRAQSLAAQWRLFRIEHAIDENDLVRSFYLTPTDGAGIIPHQAGQHLPIRVTLPGDEGPTIRTYTISAAPSDGMYRISVKRQGRVSQYLHRLSEGANIEVRAPAGAFTIDAAASRPAVMIAAGIGITPILAMLRHIVYEGVRKQSIRRTWLFYSARSRAEQAFGDELDDLAVASGGNIRIYRLLTNPDGAVSRVNFDAVGRIDLDVLKRSLPWDDYEFYLCGPPSFMQGTYSALRSVNVSDSRIFAESFGPASISRSADTGSSSESMLEIATHSVPVRFVGSSKEAIWSPESGSLLEFAEAQGLSPAFSCRAGTCGTCATRIIEGAVTYKDKPLVSVGTDQALICCAYPANNGNDKAVGLQLNI
ncbi:ferredoxin-NADP reductase/predicted pyridoxine 5'-phosphate oxidase superfamily flavin-nucleotide-binding protein [Neorhizobium galegae]|uniref:2Fe-2S iron-sulfur cluster-binding protein n=1 Tax=Neorhizobium galegae TaxID=399 RepID=UPI001AE27A95|nr:pyridoxamine 5'-phosphate oxidase family protein [Neorhizobium galegae]MBP2562521.1 ferredoxin-NADP reductase/predicted pyridoxine 5'-phosphate oxidase superfamily flavin-nucleotide-binding protein [Neorhizobium galegae]